jgi:hypothetical protein
LIVLAICMWYSMTAVEWCFRGLGVEAWHFWPFNLLIEVPLAVGVSWPIALVVRRRLPLLP